MIDCNNERFKKLAIRDFTNSKYPVAVGYNKELTDAYIEQLEAAITKYRRFVGTLECTNANCGLGSMKCSVCRIKDEPPEDKT